MVCRNAPFYSAVKSKCISPLMLKRSAKHTSNRLFMHRCMQLRSFSPITRNQPQPISANRDSLARISHAGSAYAQPTRPRTVAHDVHL